MFAINCTLTKGVSFLHLIKTAILVILVGSLNLYTLITKTLYFNAKLKLSASVRYMNAVQSVYDLLQYFVDLWYVYKYGADICLEYINRYCYMDNLLGMKYYPDMRRTIAKFLFFITIWFLVSVGDYLVWAYSDGPVIPLHYVPAYIYKFIKLLTSLHLISNVVHVESRLRTIGDHVQMLYVNSENRLPMTKEITGSTWFYPCSKNSLKTAAEYSKAKKNVKWFRCYYLLLSDQVKFINRMFGMRILLNTLSLLIEMVRLINLAVRVIVGLQRTGAHFYPAIGSLVKVLMSALMLICVVCRSEKVYEQRRRLLCLIDNLLVNKKIDESLIGDIRDFHSLVQARPISFSMAYFVRIDNALLLSIASAVVTYSVILIQSAN